MTDAEQQAHRVEVALSGRCERSCLPGRDWAFVCHQVGCNTEVCDACGVPDGTVSELSGNKWYVCTRCALESGTLQQAVAAVRKWVNS